MSPRSERSSASLPSKPPALISTPTSSPTPLTLTVTAPPATVPSTVVSASRCLGVLELLLHLLGLLEQGVHVEAAGSAERVEGVLGHGRLTSRSVGVVTGARISSITWAPSSRCEQLGAVDALVLGVEVVGVGVGVGGGQVVGLAALRPAGGSAGSRRGRRRWTRLGARRLGAAGPASGAAAAAARPARPAPVGREVRRRGREAPGRRSARVRPRRAVPRPPWRRGRRSSRSRQSAPTTSIAACRTISSQPPLTKESRAPALAKPEGQRLAVDARRPGSSG